MPDTDEPVDPQNDRRARFETIAADVYEPLQRYLRRRASRDDADDVLGDVLLIAWRRLDDIPEGASLPWCYGVARRTLANKRRGTRRHLRLVERLGSRHAGTVERDPFDEPGYPELEAALATLSDDDRELIRLWAWEELQPREIAVVLETTPNAVSLRLTRAKKKLTAELARQDGHTAGHEPLEHTEEAQ